jgi:hypothetical protein
MSFFSSMFSGPPKPPAPPKLAPVQNTALTAQIQQFQRRQGAAGTLFTQGPGAMNRGMMAQHTMTGQ